MRKSISISLLMLALAACGARSSNPVAISQPGDDALSCEQIARQVTANNKLAVEKAGGDEATVDTNVAAGAVGALIFWPAMFAIDLSNAEQIELRALRDRNRTLENIYKQKGCGA